jgi:hypothetical protein
MKIGLKEIATLRQLLSWATKGKWESYSEPEVGMPDTLMVVTSEGRYGPRREMLEPLSVADVRLVAAMHESLPDLLTQAEKALTGIHWISVEDEKIPMTTETFLVLRENGDAQVMRGQSTYGCSTISHWARITLPAGHPAASSAA